MITEVLVIGAVVVVGFIYAVVAAAVIHAGIECVMETWRRIR